MPLRYVASNHLARAVQCALLAGGVIGFAYPALAGTLATNGSSEIEKAPPSLAVRPAHAAAAQAADQKREPSKQQQKKQAQTNTQNTTSLSSVVVTAQSRKQQLEDVPIAIQVVNADNIRQHEATDISKMDIFVPGLKVSARQPTQPTFQLRGIGGSGFGVGTDSAVGVYVDGVYAGSTGGTLLAFDDVKRVEVLKGPQGTLFGRNSAAGAISIITNKPSDKVEARARLRVGNYGERWGNALLNLPAGKNMAFRLNLVDNQSDGWVTDADTGRHYGSNDDWGARLGWRWDVSDNTQVLVDYTHERLNQPPRPAFGIVPLTDDTHQRAPFPPDPSTYLNPLHVPLRNDTPDGKETRRFDGISMHIDHYMDWATLTSISAYRHFTSANPGDFDGTNHIVTHLDDINEENNSIWSQEFRLQGTSSLADWLVGASGFKENAHQNSGIRVYTDTIDTLLLNTGVPTGTPDGTLYHYFNSLLIAFGLPQRILGDTWSEHIHNDGRYSSYAVYGDVIWHLTDRINLTTGARFTRDKKDFMWFTPERRAPQLDQTIEELADVLALVGVSPATFEQNIEFTQNVGEKVRTRHSWTDFSPRVVLDDHFTDHVMGYVSVAKGYKAGGYNSLEVGARFAPEKVWNYEAGIKTVFPDQNLVFNASVYHYRYSNLQSLQLVTATSSGIPHYLTSTSNEKANGAELALQWQPFDGLTINANGAYINSKYGHKVTAQGTDISGEPTGVPKFSYAVGVQYAWNTGIGKWAFHIEQGYRGKRRCNQNSILQGTCQVSPNFKVGEAQSRTDVRFAWTSPGGHFGLALYGNNVFDHRYVEGIGNVSTSILGTPYGEINPPRMYGLEFQAKY